MIRYPRSSILFLCALCSLILLLSPLGVAAEPNARNAIITLAPISGASKVEMVAQTLDVDVVESGEGTTLNGQMSFKLHNSDRLARVEMVVGFPAWGGGAQELNDKSFTQFVITQNGQTVQPAWQTQPLKLGNETRSVRWLAWPMSLAEDERATIQVTFRQDLGNDALPLIVFAQAPAILWKGFVGSARYTIHFPALTTPEQFRLLVPKGSTFDGKSLTWLFSEYNPEVPITLQLIKPRIWRELVQAQLALAQNADAKAALTLGAQFTQLARASQSASDFAQALAALGRASELDSNSPNAPLELAKLYEAKLRGEFGAVGDEHAVRAAALEQWQRVLKLNFNSGDARDAVAQHALTLAQLARRSSHFNGALSLLEIARSAGSGKIPHAQLDREERADRAGVALQQMDAGQWQEVLTSIESGALGQDVAADWKSFQLHFNSVQATVVLADERQQIALRITPLPHPSAQHEHLLKAWMDSVSQQPEVSSSLTSEGDAYSLIFTTPVKAIRVDEASPIAELNIGRELLSPSELRVSHKDEVFTSDDEFSARYSLAQTQAVAQGKLQEIERTLNGQRAVATDETLELVRRLRVRALEFYQAGWQSLLSTSSARIEWRIGNQTWELHPGEMRELQARHTTYQTWTIMSVGLLILSVLLFGLWGLTRRRH